MSKSEKAKYFAEAKAMIMANELSCQKVANLLAGFPKYQSDFCKSVPGVPKLDLGMWVKGKPVFVCSVLEPLDLFDQLTERGYKLNLVTGVYYLP